MELNVQAAKAILQGNSEAQEMTAATPPEARRTLGPNSHVNGHSNNQPASRLQVIDDQKTFTPHLASQLRTWELADAGFDYNIVAVFGSQSTGKSTLLNRLFGTSFDVMDESRRQQTTKGIWMCKGKGMNVMVMDVEGTDGRERGEDQDFERKAALFSLASSEVLIVNLWEHQVGLYQGANMALLKTVFEVNLGLFGKKTPESTRQRTLLFFVIRDFIGATPLSNLSQTLTQDILKIWEGISKPAELEHAQLSDYFDLSFTGLPHKILMPDKFESEVVELRKRFADKSRNDFVFKTEYHKRIPADGVALYMEGIWEQVQSNKDLDLPTQQELLAQFRCDEIASVALEEFSTQARSQRRPVEAGRVVEGLGKMMNNWTTTALSRYDRDASRYHQAVYQRKRADLLASIESALSPLFLGQLKNLHKQSLVAFKQELSDGLRGESYDFAQIVAEGKARCEERFVTGASEAVLDESGWGYEDELDSLREEIGIVADQCRSDETKKLVNQIERMIKRQLSEPVEAALHKGNPTMWDDVLSIFNTVLSRNEEAYLAKAKSFNCTEAENTSALSTIRQRAWQNLRTKVDEQTADTVLLAKLRNHFEDRFRYDSKGVPRVWRPDDDIDGAFRVARDETLELIPLYSKITPKDDSLLPDFSDAKPSLSSSQEDIFDFETSLTILTETKVLDLTNRFRRDADTFYVEAKRSTVSSIAQIPAWMYGVLVVLGWNEAMTVLFNPMYFMLLLFGVSAAWIIVQLGLAGPLYQVILTVANEIQRQVTNKLREHFTPPQLEAPVAASRSNSSRRRRDEDEDEWENEGIEMKVK